MNNIFCGNTKGISSAPALTNVMYNDFYASSAHFDGTVPAGFGVLNQVNFNGTACDVFQNIFQDPLFVDAPNHDFNLQDGSLCRNAGHPATDTTANHYCYYGNPRFLEDHIDLGAAESGIWWTGAVSPDWNDAGNWSTGSVPTQAQSVTTSTLSPQNPQISAPNTTIQRLYIKDGAEVVIPYGAELHLTGE